MSARFIFPEERTKRVKVRLKTGKVVSIKYYTRYSTAEGVFILWERGAYKNRRHMKAFRSFGEEEFKEV